MSSNRGGGVNSPSYSPAPRGASGVKKVAKLASKPGKMNKVRSRKKNVSKVIREVGKITRNRGEV